MTVEEFNDPMRNTEWLENEFEKTFEDGKYKNEYVDLIKLMKARRDTREELLNKEDLTEFL